MSSSTGVAATLNQAADGPWALEKPVSRMDHFKASVWRTKLSPEDSFKDVFEGLKVNNNKPLTGFSCVLRILPKFAQRGLGHVMETFNKLPLMKNMQCWGKFFLFQDAITDVISGIYGAVKGYQNTQGNFLDKLWGGFKNGAASLFKAAIITAVNFALPLAGLALFRKSANGALGTIINVGQMVIGILTGVTVATPVEKVLNTLLPTESTSAASKELDGSAPKGSVYDATQFSEANPGGSNQRALAQRIINDSTSSTLAQRFGSMPNPWLQSAYAGEKPL